MTVLGDPVVDSSTNLSQRASVVIVTYNHAEFIDECICTVLANNPGEIIVVDNGSSDGTVELIQSEFSDITLVQNKDNSGYGAGNNLGMEHVNSEYVVVLNPDVRVNPDLLYRLLEPVAEGNGHITTPKILTYDGKEINTIGNVVHFTGLAFTKGYGDDTNEYSEQKNLSGISGACFATTRQIYQEMGGFEESIFIYMDDAELSWKANSFGYDILYVPEATIFHDYPGAKLNAEKLFHLERGRYIILRKYLDFPAVLLLIPSLVLTELLTWGYAISQGPRGVSAKVRAIRDGFSANVDKIQVDTRRLISKLDGEIPADEHQFRPWIKKVIQSINKLYRTNKSLVES